MSRCAKSFVELCLEGFAGLSEIDEHIERWHEGDYDCSLPEFLGLSVDEYALWVEKPTALRYILFARKQKQPLQAVLELQSLPIAARTGSRADADEVLRWLKETGRLVS